jgi:hypothetical protein
LRLAEQQERLAPAVGGAHSREVADTKWEDIPAGVRRFVIAGGAVEGALKIAALVDLARRPAAQVRGPKRLWAVAITLVNSLGAVPIAYLTYGRRKPG